MKTPTALSVTSSQREPTSLRSQAPRLPRSNACSTPDLENLSASVHRKRFSTPSLTLKFLCAGKLNPPDKMAIGKPNFEMVAATSKNVFCRSSFVSGEGPKARCDGALAQLRLR